VGLSEDTHPIEFAITRAISLGMFVGPCITQRDAAKAVKEWTKKPLKELVPYERDALRVVRALRRKP